MYSSKRNQLLARVNFPLYTVQVLNYRYFLIAGGGGSSRSGIRNVIEIYEILNDGSTCKTECVNHFETGDQAIMNLCIYDAGKYFLAFSGMDGNCKLFKITYGEAATAKPVIDENISAGIQNAEIIQDDSVSLHQRKRNVNKTNIQNEDAKTSDLNGKIVFKIHPLEEFQTDFSEEPFQKLVKFSRSRKFLVTGGCDGHIRFWKPPNMKKILDIDAHSDDVDDLDISPCGKLVVTVSRDGSGKVWNSENGTLVTELHYTVKNNDVKYIFRSCRFSIVEDKDFALFCTLNPAVRVKPPPVSYLCKFNSSFSHERIASTGTDMLSSMAVSDNGHFIGLGTQSGGIKIYIAFSLELIYDVPNAHGIFVTCLCFLPSSEESRRVTGGHEASLLSVSVDNHIIVHHIPERGSMSTLTLVTLCILTLFLVFLLMDFLNL